MNKQMMMMAALATTVMFGACSADSDLLSESQTSNNTTKQEIGFNIVANNNKTGRATSITGTDGLKNTYGNFDVWCMDMGAEGNTYTNTYMSQTKIEWQGQQKTDSWYYATAGTERYWTNTYLDFYAVSPSATVTANISESSKSFTYNTIDEYGSANTDKKENKDVLYATAFKQKKGSTNTSGKSNYVTMQFKHALSQLVFQVQYNEKTITGTDASVEIESITLKNVLPTGSFTFPTSADGNASISASGTAYDLTVPFAENTTTLSVPKSSETAAVVNSGKPIIVVPQELTGNVDGGSYLSIKCKIKSNGSYMQGSANSYDEVKIPFGQKWEMGKKYTYTLKFDVADVDLIMFDATAEDWTDATGATITVQ